MECIIRTMRKIIKDYIKQTLNESLFTDRYVKRLTNVILFWGFIPEEVSRKKKCTQKGFGIGPYFRSQATQYYMHNGGDLDNLIKKHKIGRKKLKKYDISDVDKIIETAKAISNDIDLIYKRHLNRIRIEKISTDF